MTIFNAFFYAKLPILKVMTISVGEIFGNFILFKRKNLKIQAKNMEMVLK